ncbi:MAG: serine dehydratase subunit alpha family protein [Ruminococcaceae bacterium]|nr:serine dehydratase subunit alpha family protein [Oscillospiraceae bacterium]
MEKRIYDQYLQILHEELVPAMGCTEPIAIAYAAALARQTLGSVPERVEVKASANIIKNVKSVVVPHTGELRGIAAAVAAGIVAGCADDQLQVLSHVSKAEIERISSFLDNVAISVEPSDMPYVFDIQVRVFAGADTAFCQIAGHHTNVVCLSKNDETLLQNPYEEHIAANKADRGILNIADIVDFADTVEINDVEAVIGRQIRFNMAIAEEGLSGRWGANIGSILLKAYGDNVYTRAKAMAAAGSDARMSGCEMPVVINSGSGNQGLTTSLPVIVYAEEMGVTKEALYRALVLANLVTIHLKTGIGTLSAYCGATSAGCGAGAGICYLHGGKNEEISHTVVNALAINSGMICDGAKASCAAKIASAVEAGLLGWQMQMHGSEFSGGDGIVTKGVENTIRNVGRVARNGMVDTDREIIEIMISSC